MSLLLCLRDWLMVLPLQRMVRDSLLQPSALQEAFKVYNIFTHTQYGSLDDLLPSSN